MKKEQIVSRNPKVMNGAQDLRSILYWRGFYRKHPIKNTSPAACLRRY